MLFTGLLFLICGKANGSDYVVLVGKKVLSDQEWRKVADRLVEIHQARMVEYDTYTSEALPLLKKLAPRYVAVVEKPECIDRKFVMDLNRMSRKVDDDIYGDFLWGIITGYDAGAALKLVERALTPQTVSSAWCLRDNDLRNGKYFDRMGLTDSEGFWYEKDEKTDTVARYSYQESPEKLLEQMLEWVKTNEPGLISYQIEEAYNQMPLLANKNGMVVPRGGKLWLGEQRLDLGKHSRIFTTQKRMDSYGTRDNISVALLNDGQVTALLGPTTYTFHGRGEWGTLKYWLTDAGRFTLAEAHFLNLQDMLEHLQQWNPRLLDEQCPYDDDPIGMVKNCYAFYSDFEKKAKENPENANAILDMFGYLYERDIWVYYGDPCWDVRAKALSDDQPYRISSRIKKTKCIVTIQTSASFSWERLCGDLCTSYDSFKDLHCSVGDLPICYFFPERLKNPRLASKQRHNLDVTVNKDFLFVRNAYLEPEKTYEIILEVDE